MRFKYSTTDLSQNEFDSLPRIPLRLQRENRVIETLRLVDSGATVNLLPYEIAIQQEATAEVIGDRDPLLNLGDI